MAMESLIVTVPLDRLKEAQGLKAILAHQSYRIGRGPHLFRAGGNVPLRGGLMALDCQGFDGRGDPGPVCDELFRECVAREFRGVVCDFETGRTPILERVIRGLGERFQRRKLELYVPEQYADVSDYARVMVSSALSGGSLRRRLEEAVERFGAERVVLAVERVAEDFYLPSMRGEGTPLTQEELHRRIETLHPSIFFSRELCARYFTYMSRESGAHFILFDDANTIRKKLDTAGELGVRRAIAAYAEIQDGVDLLGLRGVQNGELTGEQERRTMRKNT